MDTYTSPGLNNLQPRISPQTDGIKYLFLNSYLCRQISVMQFNRGNLSDSQLLDLYKEILLPRMIEEKMLILLRQGRISKWFSGIGQEAIAVGATMALDSDEYIMPLHRNLGVFTARQMP